MIEGALTSKWAIVKLAYENKLKVDENYSISDEINGIRYLINRIFEDRAEVEFFVNKKSITIDDLKRINPSMKIGQWLGLLHFKNTLVIEVFYERLDEIFKNIELLSLNIALKIKDDDLIKEQKEKKIHVITLNEYEDLKRSRFKIRIKMLILLVSQIIPLTYYFGLDSFLIESQTDVSSPISTQYLYIGSTLLALLMLFFKPIKRMFFTSSRTLRVYPLWIQYAVSLCLLLTLPTYLMFQYKASVVLATVLRGPKIKKYNVILINKCFHFVNETDQSIMICQNKAREFKGREVTVEEYLIQDKYRMLKVLSSNE